jgi:D-arabinose 1-dehydrogenase-like Zn-dependent alcohol dehydrogenase
VTAVHAFHKSGLEANDSAVVVGAGGIGLMLVQLLARAGVRTAAISRSAESLKLAQQAGAALTFLSGADDAADRIRAMAGDDKDGADCVFELVGRAETMRIAANCTMRGGKIIVIGEEAEFPPINTIEIAQRELQIVGSRNGGMQDARDAIDFLARGVIRPLVAATYSLERINEAFEAVRSGKVHGRVVIQISQ